MKHKNDMIQFAVWTRNGIAFSITWFLTLVLIYNSVTGIQSILTESLIKMMFWIIGGVLLFNLFFTRLIIRKVGFIMRLTGFMVTFGLYETLCFYSLGIFSEVGNVLQWLVFAGIIFLLYLICIAIYHKYSEKRAKYILWRYGNINRKGVRKIERNWEK